MKAIILIGDNVVGFHDSPDIEEMAALGTEYELVLEVPDIIRNVPEGHYICRVAPGQYEAYPIPKTPEQLEVTEIKRRLALTEQGAAETSLTLQQLLESLY